MNKYQDLLQRVDTLDEKGAKAREDELHDLLQDIEATRETLVADRDILARIKDKQGEIDDKLVEERADMAAKSAVLQEDENLRKAIQNDERLKMEQMKEEYLQTALEDERQRLQQEIAFEKERLEEKYQNSNAWVEKEESLKRELFQHQTYADQLKRRLGQVKEHHVGHHTQTKLEFQRIFVEVCGGDGLFPGFKTLAIGISGI